jgi:putative ABC transport system permease protein
MTIPRDLQHGVRLLRRTPGFTALAVLVVAVGIGATTTIFTLVDAAFLRPLPYRSPHELVMLWEAAPDYAHNRVAPLNFVDWSEQNRTFASMAAVSGGGRTLTRSDGMPERIPGQAVTTSFFDLLGVVPVAGRGFVPADGAPDARVVVISERLWRGHYGGDPALLGRTVTLDGEPFTVVGIVPAGFEILFRADLWVVFVPERGPEQRQMHYLQVLGRLKPGATVEQARADMAAIAADIGRISPATNEGWGVTVQPLREAVVVGELKTTSLVLAVVVALILLMASANVANLLLARGVGRTREIAVRAALGANRRRILQQLLTESLVLAGLGGVAGALSAAALRAAPALMPPGALPEGIALALDLRVTVFAVGLTVATGLIFGLAPAWFAPQVPLASAMSAGGRTATGRTSAVRGSPGDCGDRNRGRPAGRRRDAGAHPGLARERGPRVAGRKRADHGGEPATEPVSHR